MATTKKAPAKKAATKKAATKSDTAYIKQAAPKKAAPKNEHLETRKCVHNEADTIRKWTNSETTRVTMLVGREHTETRKHISERASYCADVSRELHSEAKAVINQRFDGILTRVSNECRKTLNELKNDNGTTRHFVSQVEHKVQSLKEQLHSNVFLITGEDEDGNVAYNLAQIAKLVRSESEDTRERVLIAHERLDLLIKSVEKLHERVNDANNKAFDVTLLQDSIVHLRKSNYRLRFTIVLIILAIVFGGITYAISPIIHW